MLQGVCIIASKSHALKIGSEQDTTSRRMQTRGGGRGFQPGLWFHRLGLIRSPKVWQTKASIAVFLLIPVYFLQLWLGWSLFSWPRIWCYGKDSQEEEVICQKWLQKN